MFCLFARKCTEHSSSKYLCVSISVILFVLPSGDARKFCPTEHSVDNGSNQTVSWIDYHNPESNFVFSIPRCIDENGILTKRICDNGSWVPESPPACDRISTNEYCSDRFYEYKGFCVVKYEKDVARSFISQYQSSNFRNTQNITTCDGSLNFDVEANQNEDTIPISCCTTRRAGIHGKQISYNCSSSRFVILSHDHRFHPCPENCVASELGSKKCFCKIKGSSRQNLASVDSIAQKNILAELAGTDLCEINGLTSTEMHYCPSAIAHNFYGWTSKSTNCTIVETIADASTFQAPAMVLTFDGQKRKLTLVTENHRQISPSRFYGLECFTNAGTELIRSVNTRKINEGTKDYAVYDLKLEKYIGEYWCEAFSLNLTKIKSNKALAYREKNGNEYSLRIMVKNISLHAKTSGEQIEVDSFQKQIASDIRYFVNAEVRFMKYFFWNKTKVDVLLHLTTYENIDISGEYERISERLEDLPEYIQVLEFNTVEYCLPDDISTEESDEMLHWGLTNIWDTKLPDKLCFQDNQLPVMRTCQGDFVSGAHWSELSGVCSNDVEVPPVTKFLHENLYSNISSEFVNTITSITYNSSLSYVDIYLYSELIKRVGENQKREIIENIFEIINNLSEKDGTELELSQSIFNATDNLLLILDNKLTVNNLQDNETYTYADENILIRSVNPFETNISGIYLSGYSDGPLNDMEIFHLKRNETIQDVVQDVEQLVLAVYVPESILQNIEEDSSNVSSVQIIFTVFYNDSLFVDSEQDAISKVVSVVIPDYGTYLNEPIPIIMRSNIPAGGTCGYWNLGQKIQRKRGQWSSFGGKYSGSFLNNSDLHICHFSHLTHFALLIVSESIRIDEGDQEVIDFIIADETNFHLTIITIIGTAFSIIGILGIYVTALLFKQWREKDGTKILLNLSTAILFEVVFLQFSGLNDYYSDIKCKLIGCLLHYTLLSKFCWMLIYAFLQYRRFVKVFGVAPKYLILKSTLFGWGCSAIPVVLTLIISPESYSKTNLCYVHGWPQYFAVIFPVFLVTLANLIIFIFVMYNVTTKKVESTIENKFSILQLYLAILLFFVLGVPWLFVIVAEFVTQNTLKTILMYLFCATATFQGFILFVFYVLFNEETRRRWSKLISMASR